MKKTILLLAIIPFYAFSQTYTNQASGDFSFQSFTTTYTYLSNPISVVSTWGSTHKNYTIPLPFIFPQRSHFTGAHSVIVSTEGRIEFYPGISFPRDERTLLITKFDGGSLLCDRNIFASNQKSEIGYLIDSTQSQNKICKLEFKNMGIWGGDSNNIINAQIWLYQNGNIEIHFGKQKLKNETAYRNFGIVYDDDISQYSSSLMLKGNPQTPSIVVNKAEHGLAALPSNENMVYQFIRNQTYTNTPDVTFQSLDLYPNPASAHIHFLIPKDETLSEIIVYNSAGVLVDTIELHFNNNQTSLGIDKICNGLYYLRVHTDKRKYMTRFIKN